MAKRLTSLTTGGIGVMALLGSIPVFPEGISGIHLVIGFLLLALLIWISTWLAMKRLVAGTTS